MSYQCSTCGEIHEDLPDIGADKPDHFYTVPESEREELIELTDDTCIIGNEDFFIRGVIEIPIHNYPNRFGFGVWVSQKKENFYKYVENPDSSEIGPFFGWLCTDLDFYEEETLHLKTMAHFRGEGLRPTIEVELTEHPLAIDQHEGISLERAWEIVHYYQEEK